MNISVINPVSFQAKTKEGNDYKKTYAGTIGLTSAFAAMNAAPLIFKENRTIQSMKSFISCEDLFAKDLPELFKIKVSPKMIKPLKACGIAFDIIAAYTVGKWIDDGINKKRAAKADEAAKVVETQPVDNE